MITFFGTADNEKEVLLYFTHKKDSHTFFKVVRSKDGHTFNDKPQYVFVVDEKNREEKHFLWKNLRVSNQKEQSLITYQSTDKAQLLSSATTVDFLHWTKLGKSPTIAAPGAIVPNFRYKNRYVMFYGEKTIGIAMSGNGKVWQTAETLIAPREGFFDHGSLTMGDVFQAHDNILVLYYTKIKNKYAVGAALFDKHNPTKLLWRSDNPIWEQKMHLPDDEIEPLGIAYRTEEIILYWKVGKEQIFAISCQVPGKYHHLADTSFNPVLKRSHKNPIITPLPEKAWESRATFNSAAVYEDGKVHFVYRALGDTDLSVLGYASSRDGITIDERSNEPAYIPREPWETPGGNSFDTFADHYVSGGGYGGIEDPKLTKIDDRFYMTYVAFDGCNPPRLAITSISVKDFLDHKWKNWEKPKLISAPDMVNKSGTLFPEKINGKYVMFHRVYPNILIDYLDDLEFNDYLQGMYFIPPRRTHWDSKKLSAGAPPIKTKDGWLMIYHAVGYQDSSRYKIGAMLLDANNPTKVLYRCKQPIIAPDMDYENAGHKAGVVYPCGAVVKGDELLVYYGGADTVICVASQKLDTFLEQLKYNQEPKLKRIHLNN